LANSRPGTTSELIKPSFNEIVKRPAGVYQNPFLNKDGSKKTISS
jgi:hypothetical protein